METAATITRLSPFWILSVIAIVLFLTLAGPVSAGPTPTFSSILPTTGPTTGGTAITIIGTNLTGTTVVTLGGSAATGISVVNDSAVSATTPPDAAGAVWVNLTTPNGTVNAANAFTYQVPATVAITIVNSTQTLTLTQGKTVTDTNISLLVTSSAAFSVTVADNTLRPSNCQGYMGNYSGSYVAYPLNTNLIYPLGLSGTTTGTVTAHTVTSPVSTAQTLYTGSAAVNGVKLPLTITQQVGYSDRILRGSNIYRIDLIFTIAAS